MLLWQSQKWMKDFNICNCLQKLFRFIDGKTNLSLIKFDGFKPMFIFHYALM